MSAPPPAALAGVFRRHALPMALAVLLLLVTLAAGTGLLALSGHFLTAAALAGGLAAGFNFFAPSAGIRALTFARIVSRYAEKLFGHDVTLRLARDLRLWFFARLLPLAPLGLGRERIGDLLARLVADIDMADGVLVRAVGPLLALAALAALMVAASAAVLPVAGLWMALVLGLLGGAVPLVATLGARDAERERAEARAALRQQIHEALEGAADLVALDAVEHRAAALDASTETLARRERRLQRRLSSAALLHGMVVAVALPALLGLLLFAYHDARIDAPTAAALLFAGIAMFEAAAGIGLAWRSLRVALASLRRLRDIAGGAPAVVDPPAPRELPASGELTLQHVRFAWGGDAPRPVLEDIGLVLPVGRRIAISGDSGAGKSSLLALLLRLRDPDAGSVRFGGVELRDCAQADWHRRLAWLPQDAPVFAGSIRTNLRMGDPAADDDRLWQALRRVRMEDAVRALPGGLDAWIGESGASLSGGESRRLALARALLREAPLLLLDEPTGGLDVDTARELMQDLAAACGGRSAVVISHDPLPADVVHARYRLHDGRLHGPL
ncbi:thiol reductant ABC exporter subunit CydC [Luteimonas sp. RD2P54]|uniref:Thiol reductant ABC exporter subunit CydC n=1 Tax=Luteimonas endophytica TaxID=3042023 RepID=A0ABT6J8F9_9GAMM|nr:thiol reductant ABC exporter subunit CydC [Luteimonas endophytica]MDH5823109.1 thiol reductant ABC exporter subunit CydC [Luteimonas endophytica]